MDKRSWPWKKKSSDKQAAEKAAISASDSSTTVPDASGAQIDKVKQENSKKPKYVQISIESYTHLTGLEDQVKSYEEQVQIFEDEVKELNEKLSEANSEMTNKENLVKQHVKVAEEAVSGWEKAEAEAAALKNHLESVTLLKLTAEDRATHLDGALKECMRQIRNLKDENEQKLHELSLSKTKLFDKMKLELEAKIASLDQEIMKSDAEKAAISRSLQERSNMLIQFNEEKSQANAEIELLKDRIDSCEREINSLKYELHLARKEVEIRNEERNMSVRSAEAANKQHLEGVKKIAKLEAECQRLRGLVRKKLPGPAALAQMKHEVENLDREYGESRLRRSPVMPSTPQFSQLPDFSHDNAERYIKENELLTKRLLAMDEEMKMVKEALAKRNSELQASRSICAQTASKLQSIEASHRASIPSSFATMSENGNDDNVSCAGSISEFSHMKKENSLHSPQKSGSVNHVEFMDDFLEMEKLAYQSNGSVSHPNFLGNTDDEAFEPVKPEASVQVAKDVNVVNLQLQADPEVLVKLQSNISAVLEIVSSEKGIEKMIEEVRQAMQEMHETLHHHSNGFAEANHSSHTKTDQSAITAAAGSLEAINQEVELAITQINDFIMILGKEAKTVTQTNPGGDGLTRDINTFSAKYSEVTNSYINLNDFVIDMSQVLNKASKLHFNFLGFRSSEVEIGSFDCIDKIALPENKAVVDSLRERCSHFSDSGSDPDFPNDGNLVPTSDSTATSWKCSLEEFEQLKIEKDNLEMDLARSVENLETTKSQLLETEQLLAEVKSQLTTAQKSNSLADTQLKCMAESYNSLDTRSEELKNTVNLLQGKIQSLEKELLEEKRSHEEAVERCKDLQEQLERISNCATADAERISREEELAMASEKLAECQETIFLLGKQLKGLRPQTNTSQNIEAFVAEEPTVSGMNLRDFDAPEIDSAASFRLQRAGSESPMDLFSASDCEANNLLRSPAGSKYPKHRHTKSVSSSASSTPTPEKGARGFSRFFSSKGKNAYVSS